MIELRPGRERGRTALDWLDSRHTFSFAEYEDPRHEGFRALRVINEDRVAPGHGFEPHFHRDMEILSWVLEGALEHKDGLGNGSTIRPGELQRMSAGRGVTHSEVNATKTHVHFLQIWVLPRTKGAHASYEQRAFDASEMHGLLRIGSGAGRAGAVKIDQDLELFLVKLHATEHVRHALEPGRHAWVQVARGTIELDRNLRLEAGDGAAISDEAAVEIAAATDAEALIFDLA